VADALRRADVAFANLDSPITQGGVPANKDYVFRAPALAVGGLREAGIDVVSLANNHALDYGLDGLFETLALLGAGGIVHTGAGADVSAARQPALVTAKGLRLAFLAYVNTPDESVSGFSVAATAATPDGAGVAWATPEAVAEDVAEAVRQADAVVVSLHTGFEYREEANDLQVRLAHAAIDAGADLVLGHHPHVLQGIEEYGAGLIAYSLGNFVFDFDAADYAQPGLPSSLSLVLRVHLGPEGVLGYDFLPVVTGEADGRPRLVAGEEARPVEERMARLSASVP
jgi:poly-gamma-glutamate synthesis protein (capsule biosynthesis protein)